MARSELVKGTLTLLVLSVLEHGELYGYEIAQRIRQRSGNVFAPSEGALYPALHRLEREGAVEASWGAGERGPRRRYYAITPRGTGLLAEARREWQSMSDGVSRVIGGLTDA